MIRAWNLFNRTEGLFSNQINNHVRSRSECSWKSRHNTLLLNQWARYVSFPLKSPISSFESFYPFRVPRTTTRVSKARRSQNNALFFQYVSWTSFYMSQLTMILSSHCWTSLWKSVKRDSFHTSGASPRCFTWIENVYQIALNQARV